MGNCESVSYTHLDVYKRQEGTEADGCLYQISNQITMGLTEKEIIAKVKSAVDRLSELEMCIRDRLWC